MNPAGPGAFKVKDCALIALALGRTARDLSELRHGLADAPPGCIDHHFYHGLLRPSFDDPEYRNDFALWARRQLHDASLAERLDVIDPVHCVDQSDLRNRLLAVIDARLEELDEAPTAPAGREFHFLRSQIVVFDTPLTAATPSELTSLMPHLPVGSIYHHFVRARRHSPERRDDFSVWLAAWGPPAETVVERLAMIDFNLWSLTEMRERIAQCLAALPSEARQP